MLLHNNNNNDYALITEFDFRGVGKSQSMALFDIHVGDTDALSYLSNPPAAVLTSTKVEKKWKYCAASSDRRATFFTPLCFSVDGLAGDEVNSFLQHLACSLSVKWDHHSFSDILGWLCACLAFALFLATNACF